ncbi:MAG TPA: PHB depolymerase family esterase [Jatrophihabitantaceae bacterium]
MRLRPGLSLIGLVLLLFVLGGVLAATGSPDPTPPPPPPQQPAATCPGAGDVKLDGGHLRMPEGAKPGTVRLLVAIMSGDDGDADDNLKLAASANAEGIAVLYPTTRAGSIWQLNDARGTSDVDGVTHLLDSTLAGGCFDLHRISIVGLSNGGGFAVRMACKLPGRFAAVVAVSAGYRALDPCPRDTRASFLAIHGTADTIVPFNGKLPDRKGNVPNYAARWAHRDGCPSPPDTTYPHAQVMRLVYRGCPDGLRVEVLRLSGTDHGWPGAAPPWPKHNPSGINANLEVLRFIRHATVPGA